MLDDVKRFNLSHGQVLWTLARGLEPSQVLRDEVRYFRQLEIPFSEREQGTGRGNRLTYSFDQLMELEIVVLAKRRGVKAQAAAEFVLQNRATLRDLIGKALTDMREDHLNQRWVKSRGKEIPILGDEVFLRVHNRFSEASGKFEMVGENDLRNALNLPPDFPVFPGMMVERMPGDDTQVLVPLRQLMIEAIAWAREAPVTRTGPQS